MKPRNIYWYGSHLEIYTCKTKCTMIRNFHFHNFYLLGHFYRRNIRSHNGIFFEEKGEQSLLLPLII